MRISMIAAVAKNRVIGRSGKIPWRIPEDLAFFKRTTMGSVLIMGRKTFDSLGKPLPGRTNIVLTRNSDFAASGIIVAHSVNEAMELARGAASTPGPEAGGASGTLPPAEAEVFVIGGAAIYALFMPLAGRLSITEIDADIPGDEFFPAVDPAEWRLVRALPSKEGGTQTPPFRFALYERKKS
jgi:dihydrofolate reductase